MGLGGGMQWAPSGKVRQRPKSRTSSATFGQESCLEPPYCAARLSKR